MARATDPETAGRAAFDAYLAAFDAYLAAHPAPQTLDFECLRCEVGPGTLCVGVPNGDTFHRGRRDEAVVARRNRLAQAVAAEIAAYSAAVEAAARK